MAKSFPNTGATVGLAADRSALTSPFAGMQFFETDTKRNWLYNGSTWIPDDMVFTTEAVRDAAITSPTEGMHAYLTASTVAAATGQTTAVPTGIQTIYNGAAWVCVTEVGASSLTSATTTSTSYVSTLTGDTTAVSVTLSTGTTAKVEHGAFSSTSGVYSQDFTVSGATTRASNDSTRLIHQLGINGAAAPFRSFVLTGLTAGTNTFTLQYKTDGSLFTATHRVLTVKAIA